MTVAPIAVTSFGVLPSSRWPYFSSAFGIGAFGSYRDPLWSQDDGHAGYPAYAQDPFDAAAPTGGLRLKVEPNDAEVFVDGYFAGAEERTSSGFLRAPGAIGSNGRPATTTHRRRSHP